MVAANSSENRGGAGPAMVAVVEEISDGEAEGAVMGLPGRGAVVQSLSTPPRPVATSIRHRTQHTFPCPKIVRQLFTPAIPARGPTAATKLAIAIRNIPLTSTG